MSEMSCMKCRVDDFKNSLCEGDFCKMYHGEGDGIDFINAVKASAQQERKTGEWKEVAEPGLCDLRRCSNCGHIEAVGLEMITPKPNFCPNCGADMRGENT